MSSSIILQAGGCLAVIFVLTWLEPARRSQRPWHFTVSFSGNWTLPEKPRKSWKIPLQAWRLKGLS